MSAQPLPVGTLVAGFTNTQGERITIQRAAVGDFAGAYVLVIHDDPPPVGTGVKAPMLLDEHTRAWLRTQLDALEQSVVGRRAADTTRQEQT